MALTANTIFDIIGQTQTLNYTNPSVIETISFANNQITYSSTAGFKLNKTDLALYFTFINVYCNLLVSNFPSVNNSTNIPWPLSVFSISETNTGGLQIAYNQTSSANTVLNIAYHAVGGIGAFTARPSPVTISLQEFFMTVYIIRQYFNQVSFN